MLPSEIIEKLAIHIVEELEKKTLYAHTVQSIIVDWLLNNNISIKENG